jgi:hypothetical protein
MVFSHRPQKKFSPVFIRATDVVIPAFAHVKSPYDGANRNPQKDPLCKSHFISARIARMKIGF